MKLPTYQWLGQMFAAIGVVTSLGFVAYELKLTRDAAMADVFQQRSSADMEYHANRLNNPDLREALNKPLEKLTRADILLAADYYDGFMISNESIFFQFTRGLAEPEEWSRQSAMIRDFGTYPCYQELWRTGLESYFRQDFIAEVNRIWKKNGPPPKCDDRYEFTFSELSGR